MVTSIQKTSLVQGGSEVLFYSTLMGALGIMSPFSSREDMDFFTYLEVCIHVTLAQPLPRVIACVCAVFGMFNACWCGITTDASATRESSHIGTRSSVVQIVLLPSQGMGLGS